MERTRTTYCAECGGEDQVRIDRPGLIEDGRACAHCNEPEGDYTDQSPADLYREISDTLWDNRHHFENIQNAKPGTYWVEWCPRNDGGGRHFYAFYKDNDGDTCSVTWMGKVMHYQRSTMIAACVRNAFPASEFTAEAVEATDHSIYPARKGAPSHDDAYTDPVTEDYRAACPTCGEVSRYTTDVGFDPGCEHYLTADGEHFFFFGHWKGLDDE